MIVEGAALEEFLLCSLILSGYMFLMYMSNRSGQKIIDDSLDIFYQTYDSMWYCAPISTQKMLLVIIHRSSIQCSFHVTGIFMLCYEGFSTLVSSSFSYFSVLYSIL
ncbi:uncharacterized protein LOC143150436 isoform X2 [Ptiloglossa arizonensis]|uniref:uncharacterized protein LOC143150436 isoform X2 n=1 Tax=Ptiloglossa arizonensis TaxID=3350558 RepID=UPI003F9F9FE0